MNAIECHNLFKDYMKGILTKDELDAVTIPVIVYDDGVEIKRGRFFSLNNAIQYAAKALYDHYNVTFGHDMDFVSSIAASGDTCITASPYYPDQKENHYNCGRDFDRIVGVIVKEIDGEEVLV